MGKIVHVITGLGNGGAEGVLSRLCLNDRRHQHVVISLMDEGVHGTVLRQAGVEVHALGMPRGRLRLKALLLLYRLIREARPLVVQTWMYHADLLGGIVTRLAGTRALVWGIRLAYFHPAGSGPKTRRIARLCGMLSGFVPRRIVSCSERAVELHAHLGYRRDRMVVIPNGYDLVRFAPDQESRRRQRAAWGVTDDRTVLGMVARWDPQKDHATLLAALAPLKSRSWQLILAGTGMSPDNEPLVRLIAGHGLERRVVLVGRQADVPAVMNGLDLNVLSSRGEGFPNVIAEAMACGVPCVATDTGDAELIVGSTGWLVSPEDPWALQQAIDSALREAEDPDAWSARKRAARARVVERFDLARMVEAYHRVWDEVVTEAS